MSLSKTSFKKMITLSLFASFGLTLAAQAAEKYHCQESFDLGKEKGKTFLALMQKKVYPAMDKVDAIRPRISNNVKALEEGQCVGVKLDDSNFTWHANFPKGNEMGGRSFGLSPGGKVSDPSDAEYLTELQELMEKASDKELKNFVTTLIEIIGNSDASGVKELSALGQRVATDFVAVYIAEQRRHLIGNLGSSFPWDDALLQVTLLAIFHAGQPDDYYMFYEGKFTNKAYDPYKKTYKRPQLRAAGLKTVPMGLIQYWQFTPNPPNTRSGINITRSDFTKMGTAITNFERTEGTDGKKDLAALEKLIKKPGSKNILQAVSDYFINLNTPSALNGSSDAIAKAVANLMMSVKADASDINTSLLH